MKLIVVEL